MVKVGIIGCGSITKFRHAPEYAANCNSEIGGFFDPVTDRAVELVKQFGGKAYPSYEAMLADKEIDAVSVCTSNKYHAPVTIEALKAGKHVLCEKPMAVTVDECAEMVETAKKNGKYLMIGHHQRLVPAHIKAKEILNTGELGKILCFRTIFATNGPENWSVDKSTQSWFFKKSDTFMGVMGDLGIHRADLMRWLINDEIVEVSANLATLDKKDEQGNPVEVDDNALCILKFKSGIIGTLTAGWTNYGDMENGTVIYCAEGVLKINDNPEFPVMVIKKNGEKLYYKTGRIPTIDGRVNSRIIDLFIKSIVEGIQPEISGVEGMTAMKIVFACIESAQRGTVVAVDPC